MDRQKLITRAITKALTALGVTGVIRVKSMEIGRYEVFKDGQHFGIFDMEKRTFVD